MASRRAGENPGVAGQALGIDQDRDRGLVLGAAHQKLPFPVSDLAGIGDQSFHLILVDTSQGRVVLKTPRVAVAPRRQAFVERDAQHRPKRLLIQVRHGTSSIEPVDDMAGDPSIGTRPLFYFDQCCRHQGQHYDHRPLFGAWNTFHPKDRLDERQQYHPKLKKCRGRDGGEEVGVGEQPQFEGSRRPATCCEGVEELSQTHHAKGDNAGVIEVLGTPW